MPKYNWVFLISSVLEEQYYFELPLARKGPWWKVFSSLFKRRVSWLSKGIWIGMSDDRMEDLKITLLILAFWFFVNLFKSRTQELGRDPSMFKFHWKKCREQNFASFNTTFKFKYCFYPVGQIGKGGGLKLLDYTQKKLF